MKNVTCITKNNFVTDMHIEMKIQFFADVSISQVIKKLFTVTIQAILLSFWQVEALPILA